MNIPIGFQPRFLDFRRGIHVGNLEENERITRLLKLALEARFGEDFVTERYGRGVYWRWIGFLPRSNRAAKPLSSHVSFGCAKFFVSLDVEDKLFKCGMQVERGYIKAPKDWRDWMLASDWDWHRLIEALKPRGPLGTELKRLMGEGFRINAGSWDEGMASFDKRNYSGPVALRRILEAAPASQWAGCQLFYPMTEADVQRANGQDLIESMVAAFREVTAAMNLCMQVKLVER